MFIRSHQFCSKTQNHAVKSNPKIDYDQDYFEETVILGQIHQSLYRDQVLRDKISRDQLARDMRLREQNDVPMVTESAMMIDCSNDTTFDCSNDASWDFDWKC